MSEIDRNTVRGGKTVYGAAVGILVLETKFPRMPGDIGYAPTWPSPVLYGGVRGASGEQVMTATPDDHPTGLLEAFLKAGAHLVRRRRRADHDLWFLVDLSEGAGCTLRRAGRRRAEQAPRPTGVQHLRLR